MDAPIEQFLVLGHGSLLHLEILGLGFGWRHFLLASGQVTEVGRCQMVWPGWLTHAKVSLEKEDKHLKSQLNSPTLIRRFSALPQGGTS